MTCWVQDYVGLRGILASACAVLTLPVFGLLAFSYVPPLVSTIWLGVTYSFAAVSSLNIIFKPINRMFLLFFLLHIPAGTISMWKTHRYPGVLGLCPI